MTKKESIIILFSITLCWSSTYVFIKDIPQEFSVYAYLALTSGVAGAILAFVMRRKLRLLNRVSLRQGLILGALVTASNMFEKMGLDRIPAPVGLVFGPVGALACAMGKLLGDMAHFSRYGGTVVLGAIGNFALAYIPYKVWRAMDGDAVCVHSWRQIGLYVWSAAIGCMFCALLLGFGLEAGFGQYFAELMLRMPGHFKIYRQGFSVIQLPRGIAHM